MDDATRRMLDAAFEENDRVMADSERRQRKIDAMMQKRSAPQGELVHKTNYNALITKPRQQQGTPIMDAATSDAWSKWLSDYVAKAIEQNNEMMVEAVAQFASEYVSKHLEEVTAKLRAEIRKEFEIELGQVRAEMHVQTGIQCGEIAQLKKGKHVA